MPQELSPVLALVKTLEARVEPPKYSDKEKDYLSGLRIRLEAARNQRDQELEEFDGMSYTQYWEKNEQLANTYIGAKKNKEDTNFQSGTIRQKLFALLSALANLNLSGDVSAYDKHGLRIQGLGDAMEDVILKTNELDGDEEKKFLRQYELLKHGHVFVEELWDERQKKSKKAKGKFTGKLDFGWTERIKKAFARPSRNIVPGLNVYLGDISKYSSSDQPYIFTVDRKPYEEAKMIFGEWERWENVPKKMQKFDLQEQSTLYNSDWRLLDTPEGQVEIIRYQDKWNNEFAVLLNGVLMTPVGLLLPWGYEDYNIAQQNLEPIHAKFAYGRSLVFRVRNKVAILDELIRLAILKTQKSFMPPRYNISGRYISNRVLFPGKINYGLQPGSLPPIEGENEGVSVAELNMIKELQASIDSDTTSPTFQGQQAEGDPTATEIIELQRQAKMILGLTIFAASMLEWKLEWLRLQNIVAHWFEPEDQVMDEVRGELRARFRTVSVERPVENEGVGIRMTIPSKPPFPSPSSIMKAEDVLTKEQGRPVRMLFVNPEEITSSKLVWQITVRPKEKRSSETDKLLFRAFMADIAPLGPNISFLRDEFSKTWNKDPNKLFAPNPGEVPGQPAPTQGTQGKPGQGAVSPRTSLPSAESALSRNVRTAIGASV